MMPGVLHYNEPATEEAQKELALALGRFVRPKLSGNS